jgi:hypothetical protein
VGIEAFEGHKYINLETYRKTGTPVTTPVWFTIEGENLFVVTRSETGKVKRLRNNGAVRVMPCGPRGERRGEWANGRARFLSEEELEHAIAQRNKKYGFAAKIAGWISARKGGVVGIAISLA